MTFEMPDTKPPTFSVACDHLQAHIRLGRDENDDTTCITHFSAEDLQYVDETLSHAQQLHKNGEVEAAWFYFCKAKAFVEFRNGVMEGRYQSSDEAGAARISSLNGKMGAKKKKEIEEEKREKHVLLLLSMHEATPFLRQNQLIDAASKLGPHGGFETSDDKWAKRLIDQTRLKSLYDSLSKKRKP